MKRFGILIGACVAMVCVAGCASAEPDTQEQILALAGQEAGQIPAVRDRLARQLNIADIQNNQGQYSETSKTLANAETTLRSADSRDLDDETRLAGWISISELSRTAGDLNTASGAVDQAISLLHSITPEVTRTTFVVGVAGEVLALRGKAASAKLLMEGGAWADQITDLTDRRRCYSALAWNLFGDDDFNGGRDMLRRDKDAVWRVDTLLAMSRPLNTGVPGAIGETDVFANSSQPHVSSDFNYGTSLDYQSNFVKKKGQ